MPDRTRTTQTAYKVDSNGVISQVNYSGNKPSDYPYTNIVDAINESTKKYSAAQKQAETPKLINTKADDFMGAVDAFRTAVDAVGQIGIENLNTADRKTIDALAKQVRDFDSKDLGKNAKQIITNITDAQASINNVFDQIETVRVQKLRTQNLDENGKSLGLGSKELEAARNRYQTEQDTLRRVISQSRGAIPGLSESLTRIGLEDVVTGLGGAATTAGGLDAALAGLGYSAGAGGVPQALTGLSAQTAFGGSSLLGKLNSQVTDDQIKADLLNTRKTQAQKIYQLGNDALVDLNSQLEQANAFMAKLPESDARRKATQASIDNLKKSIASVTSDTNAAKSIYDNPGEVGADLISSFRQQLKLPEERALEQIGQIDPNLLASARGLSEQYKALSTEPLGATTSPETEALRRDVESRIASQVALGAQLGSEEQRQYQQAARAAQTARGNIFGVAPAVEEAVQTGLAGEQRMQARLGAAASFLGSGQTMSDALARDVALRNSLQQSRLGAANAFLAGGANPYNLASQYVGGKQAQFAGYLAANQPTTSGFAAAQPNVQPYMYVNPNAGFVGAQNAGDIYKTLTSYQGQTYGDYARAIASQPSFGSEFANIAGGVGGLIGKITPGGWFCWVAREVYGENNPKWLMFRKWMLNKAPKWLLAIYIKFGERFAKFIKNKPFIKNAIRFWMDGRISNFSGAI